MRAVRTLFTLLFFIVLSVGALATTPPPPPTTTGGSTPSCWPPPCVPIDGGIGLLIVAGAAYGAKKMLGKRKKSSDPA